MRTGTLLGRAGGRDVAGEREELGDRRLEQGGGSREGAAAAASGWAMGRLIAAVSGQPRGSLHLPREVPYRQDAPLPGSPLQALLQPLLGGLSARFESF